MHKLARSLWRVLVCAVVLLALYVSLGRFAVQAVAGHQQAILAEINRRLPFTVEASSVRGSWRSFCPELVLDGLRLRFPGAPDRELRLDTGRVQIDPLASLLQGELQVSRLQLDGLVLPLELDAQGRLRLAGFAGGDPATAGWVKALVLGIETLELRDNQLQVRLPGGDTRELSLEFSLRREGSQRELSARAQLGGADTVVRVGAVGLGNPFEPATFEGRAYVGLDTVALAALADWLPAREALPLMSGTVDLEAWLSWAQGRPHLRTRVHGSELSVAAAGGEWTLPVEELSFDAALRRQNNNWRLFAQHLQLTSQDIHLVVPRLQVDMWGDSLRLRGERVPVGPASQLFAALDTTAPALAEALAVLEPRGLLSHLEISLDDRRSPGRDWQLAANFSELQVQSWRAAPGIRSAAGFVQLAPGRGQVILDAQDFSLDFPTVYEHSLDYDDIHGTVDITWDSEGLSLHSGRIVARAPEGETNTLFGLQVPFVESPAGITMDLLVGLRDSTADHRDKYLPKVLNDSLLQWLRDSPREGRIEQGAFLWRGSLNSDAADLRTIQLYFVLQDAGLQFQRNWPPLSHLYGLVLIDDTNVSVWADTVRLYDSRLQGLSAEAWTSSDRGMYLAVRGSMQSGELADGLRLVRESPLADLTAHTFDDWRGEGELDLDLALELGLTSSATPPRVMVSAGVARAALDTGALALRLSEVGGRVRYHSATGFDSRDLGGRLWGRPFTARLGPLSGAGGPGLAIDLAGEVPARSLQRWLELPQPQAAKGVARVSGRLSVPQRGGAILALQSDLKGLALTLPQPLAKPAGETLPLSIQLALGSELPRRLDIDLQGRFYAAVLLADGGRPVGADIALQDKTEDPRADSFVVRGHLPSLDVNAWREWLQPVLAGAQADGGTAAGQGAWASLPQLRVEKLQLDSLILGAVELHSVLLSGRRSLQGGWQASVETDWLQASLSLAPGLKQGELNIGHLDLAGLRQLGYSAAELEPHELPALAVSVAELADGVRPLGHLAFRLTTEGGLLNAAPITGELAGFTLSADAPARLRWQRGTKQSHTRLEAVLGFDDLGEVLRRLGYEHILETGDGDFDLKLDWPGGPQQFALANVAGQLDIDVDSGRFLSAPAGTSGTLRVVSIFNLTEIVRRLSLSHMFESGIPFDSVSGEVFFHRGTIEVPKLDIDGASSSFAFSGVSPVAERTIDGDLVATLPVASNLPWVAALAAGLPVAAGVFVVSKVFEKQVNQMSSAVYRVSGSWDEPEVRFSRVFDTGGRQRSAARQQDSAGHPKAGGEEQPPAAEDGGRI
ncbi:MAG: YhdP family protein [Parahaliea sp.]